MGVPRDFKGLSSRDSSGQVRVGDFFNPRFKLLVKSTRFHPIAGAVNREEPVLKWFRAFPFLGETWCLRLAIGSGEFA